MARHGPMVLGVCRRFLRDHHDAEDAFQARLPRPGPQGRHAPRRRDLLGNWLYGVAHRVATSVAMLAARRTGARCPTDRTPSTDSTRTAARP